jgi:hypothetical protein
LFKTDLSNVTRAYKSTNSYQQYKDVDVQDFLHSARISCGADDRSFIVDEKVRTDCHQSSIFITTADLVNQRQRLFKGLETAAVGFSLAPTCTAE